MISRDDRAHASQTVGNVYDKYRTRNPVARALMRGFLGSVVGLCRQAAPRSVLEVGCGEGRLADYIIRQGPAPDRFEACDISLSALTDDLDPRIRFREASVYALPHQDAAFDLVICCEVLEHLAEPETALAELARVAKSGVLISTPREPLWRALNLLRGSYWTLLGNTPGHLHHFSRAGLIALAKTQLKVQRIQTPIPWTIVLGQPLPPRHSLDLASTLHK